MLSKKWFDIFAQIAERTTPIPELLDQGLEGVPGEQTHRPEPSVDGRTLWLLF